MFEYSNSRENLEHSREVVLVDLIEAEEQQLKISQQIYQLRQQLAEIDAQIEAEDGAELAQDIILERQELEDFEGLTWRDEEVAGDWGGDY